MTQPSPTSTVWVSGPTRRGDLGAVADGDDPAVGHRERLSGGPLLVDGQYGSGDDEIGFGHVHKPSAPLAEGEPTRIATRSSLAL